MNREEALNAVVDLLRDEIATVGAELLPSSRLRQDLCIDGDDAVNLVQRLHEKFGTDFLALGGQWEEFFDWEGASVPSVRFGMIVLSSIAAGFVACFVASVWSGAASRLSADIAFGLAAATTLGTAFIANRGFPAKPKRPVTVMGLAEIVRDGAWPNDPAMVR